MEGIMTVLTDKEQSLLGAVGISGMSTDGASLAGVVGIDFDGHVPLQEGFVGNHALQLGKTPFGVGCIRTSLLFARFLATFALCPFSNICQVLQADEAVGVLSHDALGDHMIGVGFQPSLSSADRHKAAGGGTSAFLLQTPSQSRIMVGFGNHTFAALEGWFPSGRGSNRQIAHPYINAYYLL